MMMASLSRKINHRHSIPFLLQSATLRILAIPVCIPQLEFLHAFSPTQPITV